ncbi:DsbA family oxidoreductase [Piscinibacter gummiphilus]|uniref:Disulfide bond formation protein DsbA n=1 Tax=Piscinibacter gummiphilus TaxID=946333 RepID=A0A1W6LCK2_9BURK|nr:DsbA family oxidoreductase [Piscinibacter gummiphilus]ARN21985.1 disulfide bond formation protein DsbA [Piscinibacter gummiphilus]ATU66669.1 DsbA family oxidoreductase [Piscinibacter gummiphilus]GLS94056.1 DSBA oxidoreductase [Piscinibacter gummiphilus]
MKIDFVSDVSCPWCAIGLRNLETALERIGPDLKVDLHFQPFELNPNMGPEGQDIAEHLGEKYGLSPEQLAQNSENIRARGESVGFTFSMGARRRIYNTFDAHRLLHWAEGEGRQHELKQALFKAYFTDGQDPSDTALLVGVAGEVGLDAARAQQVLDSGEFADEVRQQERFYQQQGIHAVPAVIIDDRHLIQGGQPAEVFEQALRQIAAAKD